ncbi:BadF/BadG/BcrA/BcrD ATPase family protein [Kineococcus sp. SYSU DK003]|uniref:BadF/BadG/BcrA/BcrD ATPase family protein n=1 Tax=Kineococcus sp. SYSU DK003 TaxID=3383124 RepID=UPI003D7D8342
MSQRGRSFVVAVDSGGTETRVGCFGLDGRPLSTALGPAGAAHHDHDAAANLTSTVRSALDAGGLTPTDARALVAGVSGIARRGSNQGGLTPAAAREFYPMPWLDCPVVFVNDAVVAHRGALLGRPGVVVVAGTGSMVLAIDGDGREVESGQFEHYAGAARHLVFDVVHQLLQERATAADADLLTRVLDHWGASDVAALRSTLLDLATVDRNEAKRRWGALAPAVTELADASPVADRALRELTDRTASGVLLLAPLVGGTPVPVALTGSLAQAPAFRQRLRTSLRVPGTTVTDLVPTALGAVGGAALLALQRLGLRTGSDVVANLRAELPVATVAPA